MRSQLATGTNWSWGSILGTTAIFTVVTIATMVVIGSQSVEWLSWDSIQAAAVVLLLMAALITVLATRTSQAGLSSVMFRLGLVLWWFLTVVEQLFPRRGASETLYEGSIASTAYAEAVTWLLVLGVLAMMSLWRSDYLTYACTGSMKWVAAFTLVCVLSSVYSPRPMFSLAWSFKLVLVVLILSWCASGMHTLDNVRSFLKANMAALFVLTILPLFEAFADPSQAFAWGAEGFGRLNAVVHPVAVSQWASLLMLVSLVLYFISPSLPRALCTFIGLAVMVLAGGKAAIIAGILGAILFLVLRKSYGIALTFGAIAVLVIGAALVFTPLASHLRVYNQAGLAGTLTGRTDLWEVAWPAIVASPILGHGFMASKFIAEQLDTTWDAGHLHNGFLEALYNNGIIGLFFLLAIHVIIVRNLLAVLRRSRNERTLVIAAGAFAIWVVLLLNGFVEASFGGRPSSFFMLLMALVPVSDILRRTGGDSPEYMEL